MVIYFVEVLWFFFSWLPVYVVDKLNMFYLVYNTFMQPLKWHVLHAATMLFHLYFVYVKLDHTTSQQIYFPLEGDSMVVIEW